MRKIVDWLDDAKRITGSDYATAKKLGTSRQMVSKMRSGATIPSNKTCERLAEIINVSPLEIIASCEVEKDPNEAGRWQKWLGAAAILSCVVMADSLFNSMAYAEPLTGLEYTLCEVMVYAVGAVLVYNLALKLSQGYRTFRW